MPPSRAATPTAHLASASGPAGTRKVQVRGYEEERRLRNDPPHAPPAFDVGALELLHGIHVPTDLVQVRAYVRWEEAGMPQDTSAEW